MLLLLFYKMLLQGQQQQLPQGRRTQQPLQQQPQWQGEEGREGGSQLQVLQQPIGEAVQE